MPAIQSISWILTIPVHLFIPYLPPGIVYIRGQQEKGNDSEYHHWQLVVYFDKKATLKKVRDIFGPVHAESTRSVACDAYVWKEDTRVEGTRFELGAKKIKRASSSDWDLVLQATKSGKFDEIPADILIRNYASLRRIHVDSITPVATEKEVYVFWGRTGSGKSKLAWEEATMQAYPKSPTSIWWCGYQGHENVVVDEFRGVFI